MKRRGREKKPVYVGDFETTVYKDQTRTDVWASALTMVGDTTDHVDVFSSLPETYDWVVNNIHKDCVIYYHNLKFDGEFWLCYLMERGDYEECFTAADDIVLFEGTSFERTMPQGEFQHDKDMPPGSYKYLISDMGAWYNIKIKRHDGYIIELRDSLKLIPCSVRKMGTDFKTKHQKTEIEYTGYRVPGGIITDEEKNYIANDVLVVKEVLEIMFAEGHDKLTIGACCLSEYKKMVGATPKGFSPYDEMYPDLTKWKLDLNKYSDDNADAYIRRAYHGGWCYVKKSIQGQPVKKGCTADVNSLYPSCMSGESGYRYPIGLPKFFDDLRTYNKIKDDPIKYYFIRVRLRFQLKEGYLPFIQIKRNKLYTSTEMLTTSDVYDSRIGKYHKFLWDRKTGEKVPTSVVVTFSKTDWELVQEHYNITELEVLDGCWFYTSAGIFDQYINKYRKIKETAKGAQRQIAKLFLNNLYGKMAAGINSSFKRVFLNNEKSLGSETIFECNKTPGYIAAGAAITSYARAFTVRAAQKNYDVFCYADTDSVHCSCSPDQLVGIPIHESKFLHWKIESEWDQALFVRQKTYAEHIVVEDGEPCDPHWEIKCAGLPAKCKKLLNLSIEGLDKLSKDDIIELEKKYSEEEFKFISTKREISDFKQGLKIPGKLLPVHIPGGVVLADVYFTLR